MKVFKISNLEKYEYTLDLASGVSEKKEISDQEIFALPLNNASMTGRAQVTIKELRRMDKIISLIEGKKEILLEEEDYAYLKEKFNSYSLWPSSKTLRAHILKAADKLEKAEQVEVKEEK